MKKKIIAFRVSVVDSVLGKKIGALGLNPNNTERVFATTNPQHALDIIEFNNDCAYSYDGSHYIIQKISVILTDDYIDEKKIINNLPAKIGNLWFDEEEIFINRGTKVDEYNNNVTDDIRNFKYKYLKPCECVL